MGRDSVEAGVPYGSADGRSLSLDIYRPPPGRSMRGAVIQLHGGAFRRGSPAMMAPRAEALSALGFLCLAAEYRFVDEAPWPAQIHDVKAAIRWARANAGHLDIEPDRIVVQGHSAGGHLALMAAGTADQTRWEGRSGTPGQSSQVAAAIGFYPVVEFFGTSELFPAGSEVDTTALLGLGREDGSGPAATLLGAGAEDAAAADASPINHVSSQSPPTLLLHGLSDPVVGANGSRRMHAALRQAGVTCDLALYDNQIHEFDAAPVFAEVTANVIDGFLRRTLIEPERFENEQQAHNPFLQAR